MVRKIKMEDAPSIALICKSTLNIKTNEEIIKERIQELSDNENYYIAVYDDGSVSGFLQAEKYTLLYGEKGFNIISLAVAKEKQNKGYGKALLKSLEDYAKGCGCTFIRLNSRIERENAHGFYLHLGYVCDKVQKRFIKDIK